MKYIKKLNINFNNWDEIDNVLNEFIGHENFYNFLKDNNILDKYINYFNISYKWREINDDDSRNLNEFLNNWAPYYFIIKSFLWKKTKEHHKFWFYINNKWKNKLENSKN